MTLVLYPARDHQVGAESTIHHMTNGLVINTWLAWSRPHSFQPSRAAVMYLNELMYQSIPYPSHCLQCMLRTQMAEIASVFRAGWRYHPCSCRQWSDELEYYFVWSIQGLTSAGTRLDAVQSP